MHCVNNKSRDGNSERCNDKKEKISSDAINDEIYKKKKEIRSRILELRKNASRDYVDKMSGIICDKVLSLREFQEAEMIMAYMDFRNEVKTGKIIAEALARKKKIVLPVMSKSSEGKKEIRVYNVNDPERELKRNSFGIPEPDPSAAEQAEQGKIDLILVPGVAFGLDKNRLGYGAGYYDRFLATIQKRVPKVGLAFEFQVVDEIPADSFDIPVDMIVTEKRIIK